jgi:hypothetical protein
MDEQGGPSAPERGEAFGGYELPSIESFRTPDGQVNQTEIDQYIIAVGKYAKQGLARARDWQTAKSDKIMLLSGRIYLEKPLEEGKSGHVLLDPAKLEIALLSQQPDKDNQNVKMVPYAHLREGTKEVESFSLFLLTNRAIANLSARVEEAKKAKKG